MPYILTDAFGGSVNKGTWTCNLCLEVLGPAMKAPEGLAQQCNLKKRCWA